MRSPITLSALTLLASSAIAAPLLGSTGSPIGSTKGVVHSNADATAHSAGYIDIDLLAKGAVKGNAELKVFVDLLKLQFDAFAKWSHDVCVASCHQDALCAELSAYVSASFYAYITGSAGADLFAAIGSARVDRWHTVLDGICSAPAAYHHGCDSAYLTFNSWAAAAAKVDLVTVTATRAKLNGFNLFATLDAYAKTTVSSSGGASAHASRSYDAKLAPRLVGASSKLLATVDAAAKSVTSLKIGKDGLKLGSLTGVASNGFLLVDGLALPDVLAKYGAVLDDKTFLSLDKGTLYLFSSTTAAVEGFTGIKLGKRLLGDIAAGAKAKLDAVVAGTVDKHGLRLGAITGLASNGVLLVDGKLFPDVLAAAGIKLDIVTKGFLNIGKDGLFFFSSSDTDASAFGPGTIKLRRDAPFAPTPPTAGVLGKLKTTVDSASKLKIDKHGIFLGTITGTTADGVLLVGGKLLPDVLAAYGLDLKNGNFLRIDKHGLYFFSATSADSAAGGVVHVRGLEERLAGDFDATEVLEGAAATAIGPAGDHGHGGKLKGIRLDVVSDFLTKLGVRL